MKPLALLFVLGAILSWGAYVPTIHNGQMGFVEKAGDARGPIRAFLFIGLAYCLTAVLIPLFLIYIQKMEPAVFPQKGMMISTFAGVLGAIGALCIILALRFQGTPNAPLIIPPLVFAGAPIVAVFIGMILHKPTSSPSPVFYLGILMAAVGAGLALSFKPN